MILFFLVKELTIDGVYLRVLTYSINDHYPFYKGKITREMDGSAHRAGPENN